MKRETEQPKIEIIHGNIGGRNFTHPSYGMIHASRIQGTRSLFGSNINQHGFVRVTIEQGEMRRDDQLAHDWYSGHGRLIEIDMSEAQWVAFISRMNMGGGTPCTIESHNGQWMPLLPDADDAAERLGGIVDDKIKSNVRTVNKMKSEVLGLLEGLPAGKKAKIASAIEHMAQHLVANHEYAGKVLLDRKEELVTEAKIEINAAIQGALQLLGLDSIQQLAAAGEEARTRVASRLPSLEHDKGETK